MKRIIFFIFLFLSIFCVFYFSWLPNPSFKNQSYLPLFIVKWSDEFVRLRTAVPFVLIGFCLNYLLIKSQYARWKGLFISLIIVSVAEIGQFFLPHRFPDFMDVVFAQLGSLLGMKLLACYNKIIQFFQVNYEK